MKGIIDNSGNDDLIKGSEETVEETDDTLSETSTVLDGRASRSSSTSSRSNSDASTVVPGYDRSRSNSVDSDQATDISTDDPIEILANTIKQAEAKLDRIDAEIQNITTHFEEKHASLNDELMVSKATLDAMRSKYQSTPILNLINRRNVWKEVEEAEKAYNTASSNLASAQEQLTDELHPLLESRKMVMTELSNARLQLTEFKEGARTAIDDSQLYQRLDELEDSLSVREEVRSNYDKEVPELEEERDLLIANKRILEETIERKQEVIQALNETTDQIKIMVEDKKAWKNDLATAEEKVRVAEQEVKQFEPTNVFGRMAQRFSHFFGIKTALDIARQYRALVKNSLNVLNKEASAQIEAIDAELPALKTNRDAQKQQLDMLNKAIGSDTPMQIEEQINQLDIKLKRNVDTFKPGLIERCKLDNSFGVRRDKESTASVNVKNALNKFLTDSSKTNLANLIKAMTSNPKYSTDLKLTQLLTDARQLYSDIPSTKKPLLDISSEHLIQSVSREKEVNLEKMTSLETKIQSKEIQLRENNQLIRGEKQTISQNVEALKKCSTILFIAKRFSSDDKNETIANDVLIAQMEMKIAGIKNSMPASDIRALEYFDKVLKQHSGVEPEFKNVQSQMHALLEPYATRDNLVPKEINAQTFYEFKFKLDDEKQAELWEKMQDIQTVKVQLLDEANHRTRIVEASDVTPARIRVMEKLKDKAYLVYDAINTLAKEIDDLKLEKQFKVALDTLEAKIVNPDESINLLAVIEFQTTINSFDDSITASCKTSIDKLNEVMDPFASHIQWVDNPELKDTIDQIDQKNQQLTTEIQTGQREIESLQQSNALLDGQLSRAQPGDTQALIDQKIAELVKECEKPIRLPFSILQSNKEVRLSLKEFLSEPTAERLDSLKSVMKNDKSYLKNDKLVSLIGAAGELYPDLATAHNEIKQTTTPTTPAGDYKEKLQDLKTELESVKNTTPIVEELQDNSKRSAPAG